ncbi:centrosomal protein of 55 kDa [Alosa alosa]|uniref:centrosomal protein of 55 kDa n=1 Tax=Alosa alosa TaxID=278164 RepID=UPI00201515B8|nr:centrosomal protein of 55 kDa [Alosa alosa]
MAARGAKDAIVNKLGFKSNGSKMELELDKLRRENAHLKKNLDEMSRRHGHGKHSDSDKTKLLERIVSLETLRERNSQQLLSKDQEIATLRQQLRSAQGEVVASLHSQLDEKKKEAEQREKLFQSLTVETENLKNRLASVTERCQALEKRDPAAQVQTGDVAVIQDQLRDALEKNQHWLVYDQQREAYVQGLLARTQELEQQLSRPNQTFPQQGKEGPSEANKTTTAAQQEQLLKQLQEAQREAGTLREKAMQAERELAELRQRSGRVEGEAQAERQRSGQASREAQEQRERAAKAEREAEGLREKVVRAQEEARGLRGRYEEKRRELENADTLLEEERKRASDLLLQVCVCVCVCFCKHQSRFSEPSSYTRLERLTVDDPTSPSKVLDESFLECPKCHTTYPTSQHRELLTHIDYCCA